MPGPKKSEKKKIKRKYTCTKDHIWNTVHLQIKFKISANFRLKALRGIAHIHYENMPIQIYWKFYYQKNENFQIKSSDILHIFVQNIDCGYSLEPPRRGGSNEYSQSMFLSRNK